MGVLAKTLLETKFTGLQGHTKIYGGDACGDCSANGISNVGSTHGSHNISNSISGSKSGGHSKYLIDLG